MKGTSKTKMGLSRFLGGSSLNGDVEILQWFIITFPNLQVLGAHMIIIDHIYIYNNNNNNNNNNKYIYNIIYIIIYIYILSYIYIYMLLYIYIIIYIYMYMYIYIYMCPNFLLNVH